PSSQSKIYEMWGQWQGQSRRRDRFRKTTAAENVKRPAQRLRTNRDVDGPAGALDCHVACKTLGASPSRRRQTQVVRSLTRLELPQGIEDQHGTLVDGETRRVQDQVVVTRIRRVLVEVLLHKAAALAVGLRHPPCRFVPG